MIVGKRMREGSMQTHTLQKILNNVPAGKLLSSSDIAKSVGIMPQGVHRLIRNMIEAGLLEPIVPDDKVLNDYTKHRSATLRGSPPRLLYRFMWIHLEVLGDGYDG